MHVTTPIEDKKLELQKALIDGFSVILWFQGLGQNNHDKHFMPSEIAIYLREHKILTQKI